MTGPRTFEFVLLGLLATLWGSSYLFIKVAVAEIPPLTLIALRVSVAAMVLGLVLAWRREKLPRGVAIWGHLLIQAFFNGIGAWTILAWGQQYVDAGLASVLNSTSPIFVFLITALITRHEPVTWLKFAGAAIGIAGVVLIVGVDVLAGLGQQVAGQLAALAGALLYGCAAIYGKRFTHLGAPVTATATMLCAAAVLVPLSLIFEHPWTISPSPTALASALSLAVLCTGLAMLIYFRLLRTLGSMGVASQAYLRAGIGVLLGVVLLGETISPVVGVGLAFTVLGVIAINMVRRPAQDARQASVTRLN